MAQVYVSLFKSLGWRWYDFRYWQRNSVGMAIWNTTQPRAMSDMESLYTFQKGNGGYAVHNLTISKASLWEAEGSSAGMGHPAVMAIGIAANAIEIYSERDDLILDPFCGSGTTLVAAHQLGRVGYGCEISPEYVSVCLERLSLLGLKPELVSV
jgi:DNA modification methylase